MRVLLLHWRNPVLEILPRGVAVFSAILLVFASEMEQRKLKMSVPKFVNVWVLWMLFPTSKAFVNI